MPPAGSLVSTPCRCADTVPGRPLGRVCPLRVGHSPIVPQGGSLPRHWQRPSRSSARRGKSATVQGSSRQHGTGTVTTGDQPPTGDASGSPPFAAGECHRQLRLSRGIAVRNGPLTGASPTARGVSLPRSKPLLVGTGVWSCVGRRCHELAPQGAGRRIPGSGRGSSAASDGAMLTTPAATPAEGLRPPTGHTSGARTPAMRRGLCQGNGRAEHHYPSAQLRGAADHHRWRAS